jgi:signal transduction histidine kinase/CheY-like chemotaxis protein
MVESTSRVRNLEMRSYDAAGQIRVLEISGVPFLDAAGNLLGFRGISRDITERKRAEERVRKMSEVQTALLGPGTLSDKLKCITDGAVDAFGADFARIWLIRPGDRCDAGCMHAAATDDRHACRNRTKCLHLLASSGRYTHLDGKVHSRVPLGCYKIGRIASGEESSFLTNDIANDPRIHDPGWARAAGLASFLGQQLRLPDGDTLGVLALFSRDPIPPEQHALLATFCNLLVPAIQALQADEALKESEALLEDVGRIAQIGGWEMNMVTRAARWTRTTYDLIGLNTGDPVPGPDEHMQYYIEEDRPKVAQAMRALVEDDVPLGFDARADIPGRGVRWFRAVAQAERQHGRCVRLRGTLQDVTERKRAEDEKARLETQLLQAQKMETVGRLAGGIAHDFNNMLGVILGHLDLLMMGPADISESLQSSLVEIRKAAERSAMLTRQLLAYARKQAISPRVLDLNETVDGMATILRRLIGDDISLELGVTKDLWLVEADPSQIHQLLTNLCVNSRDAIAGVGQITIRTGNVVLDDAFCREHAGSTPGEFAVLSVTDDGAGMNEETQRHLFEPFFTTKEVGKGTGLGLATVYGIATQHNGFVEVSSKLGAGTTFRVHFPRYRGSTAQVQDALPVETKGGHETILVVEDEPAVRAVTAMMISSAGYRVLEAGTPSEAIRLAQAHQDEINLLITDIVMPEMNGQELATALTALIAGLKCLFVSGYTPDGVAARGVSHEGALFLQKPFTVQSLADKVREALDA